jgi:hypothetical protein
MGKRLILLAILTIAGAVPAAACNCPKEQLIKEHGTVGVFAPRLGPIRPVVQAKTTATAATAAPLPLLVPIRETLPAGPTSLEWLLLDR